jgi:hypothetical protein
VEKWRSLASGGTWTRIPRLCSSEDVLDIRFEGVRV